jgi:hypothetical protein
LVLLFLARIAMPVWLETFCFVDVTLWTTGESASRITVVPAPTGNAIASSGDVLVWISPPDELQENDGGPGAVK